MGVCVVNFVLAFLRSFVLQASWNFHRLQATGWCVAIEPLLRLLPGGKHGRSYRDAMARASQYFNSHPFFANFAIGAVAKAEHKGVEAEQIEAFRDAIKGPLGSVGDRLIWIGLLPVSSSLGLLVAVLGSPLAGVVTFLVAFNVVNVTIRVWGLREGWRRGFAVSKVLNGPLLQQSVKLCGFAAPFAIGLITPVLAEQLLLGFETGALIAAMTAALLTVLLTRWLVPSVSAARLGTAAIVIALLLGGLWQ